MVAACIAEARDQKPLADNLMEASATRMASRAPGSVRIYKYVPMVAARADEAGDLDWSAQADSTVVRAHQNAAGACKGG